MSFAMEVVNRGKQQDVDLGAGTAATDLIAAVPGKRFAIAYMWLEPDTTTDISFQSAATDIAGDMNLTTAGRAFGDGQSPIMFTSAENEAFRVTRGTSSTLDGWIIYVELG